MLYLTNGKTVDVCSMHVQNSSSTVPANGFVPLLRQFPYTVSIIYTLNEATLVECHSVLYASKLTVLNFHLA